MTDAAPPTPRIPSVYTPLTLRPGDNEGVDANHAVRTGGREGAFLLAHLRPGMRLLDVGCGPGTITMDLAAAVAPGEAVGVDVKPHVVEGARRIAAARGLANVRFDVGDLLALPFPDASFDAVLAHTVLMHVRDPQAALREMRRVLRPGGIVAIRDSDIAMNVATPSTPLLEQAFALDLRYRRHVGKSPIYARDLRAHLRAAGFARSQVVAEAVSGDTLEATRWYAEWLRGRLTQPELRTVAVAEGWATPMSLGAMVFETMAWGERPDAFFTYVNFAALAWVDAA